MYLTGKFHEKKKNKYLNKTLQKVIPKCFIIFYKVHYVQKDCLKVQLQFYKQMCLYDFISHKSK